MRRTRDTITVLGDWVPSRWIRRMRPTDMKRAWEEDRLCARCGCWPDQRTGVEGDWLIEPVLLCSGCHERVEFRAVRAGVSGEIGTSEAGRWPRRGRGGRQPPVEPLP